MNLNNIELDMPKLEMNLVGILHGTQLKLTRLSPMEKMVLAFIQGMEKDELVMDSCSYLGFVKEHFLEYANKYNNHLLNKISVDQFLQVTSSLQRKGEIDITYNPKDELICIINSAHIKGWNFPILEVAPHEIEESDNTESDTNTLKVLSDDSLLMTNQNYEFNTVAYLVFSILIKCASLSVQEGNSLYIYTNQITKLPSLLRFPDGILEAAVNYLIDIKAIYTEQSLEDPSWRFTYYYASKLEGIYINKHLLKGSSCITMGK